jgi:hypothetical protein
MRIVIIILLILLGAGFAHAQKVKVSADPRIDLSKFKTYAWDKPFSPGNPIIQQTIVGAIEQAMAEKGLTKVEDQSDITIAFFAATDTDIQVGYPSWSNSMGSARSSGIAIGSQSWPVTKGSLVVDITDNKTKSSVWRGTATHTLKNGPTGDVVKDAKSVEQPIRKSIEKMFKQFPRAN